MFNCDCCGICCRHIDESEIDIGLDRGDGVCKYYSEKTKLCEIYEHRPIICNVDEFYRKYCGKNISIEEYYEVNYESCRELKEKFGR